MDILLNQFFSNKLEFLKDFAKGNYNFNSLATGLVLSCSQMELGTETILLQDLLKITVDSSDASSKAMYLNKLVHEMLEFLCLKPVSIPFIRGFFIEVSKVLTNLSASCLSQAFSAVYTQVFKEMLKLTAESEGFLSVYESGAKNFRFVNDQSIVIGEDIEKELNLLSNSKQLESVCIGLEKVLGLFEGRNRKDECFFNFLLSKSFELIKNSCDKSQIERVFALIAKCKNYTDGKDKKTAAIHERVQKATVQNHSKPKETEESLQGRIKAKDIKIKTKPYTDDLQSEPNINPQPDLRSCELPQSEPIEKKLENREDTKETHPIETQPSHPTSSPAQKLQIKVTAKQYSEEETSLTNSVSESERNQKADQEIQNVIKDLFSKHRLNWKKTKTLNVQELTKALKNMIFFGSFSKQFTDAILFMISSERFPEDLSFWTEATESFKHILDQDELSAITQMLQSKKPSKYHKKYKPLPE